MTNEVNLGLADFATTWTDVALMMLCDFSACWFPCSHCNDLIFGIFLSQHYLPVLHDAAVGLRLKARSATLLSTNLVLKNILKTKHLPLALFCFNLGGMGKVGNSRSHSFLLQFGQNWTLGLSVNCESHKLGPFSSLG